MGSMGNDAPCSRSPRSRSPARASTAPASQETASQASPTYSFESERPTSPTPPPSEAEAKAAAEEAEPEAVYDSSCESSWERHCQRRQTHRLLEEIDLEADDSELERELFGGSIVELSPGARSCASGDTLTPMSLPSSLLADSQESCSDDDWLLSLRRPVPPMPSLRMAPPLPPPPPVQLVVSSSAPVLNITFNNCASASVIVHNHDG